ncbi:MAG: hypothetical protein KA712_01020 [Myxococcales bacterium]|nr:hypothetical protein [Myxococcales bacterium]
MLSFPATVRVFVAVAPLDMRGSFDALAGAVRGLGLDPVDGSFQLPPLDGEKPQVARQ